MHNMCMCMKLKITRLTLCLQYSFHSVITRDKKHTYIHTLCWNQVARTAPRKFSTIEDIGDLKPYHNSTRKFGGHLCHLTPMLYTNRPRTCDEIRGVLCPEVAVGVFNKGVPFLLAEGWAWGELQGVNGNRGKPLSGACFCRKFIQINFLCKIMVHKLALSVANTCTYFVWGFKILAVVSPSLL